MTALTMMQIVADDAQASRHSLARPFDDQPAQAPKTRPLPNSTRLSPSDWIIAGFEALLEQGALGVRVEPLARRIGASKGSFYWHFRDLNALHQAMLGAWEDLAMADLRQAGCDLKNPDAARAQLAALMAEFASATFGQAGALEPVLREWARQKPEVATALARVDAQRIENLAQLFAAQALSRAAAEEKATLCYAVLIGIDALKTLGLVEKPQPLGDLLSAIMAA